MPKLPAFWRGGNSLNVLRNFATYCCAGNNRKCTQAASVFHSGEIAIPDLKRFLHRSGVEVRL